MDLVECKRLIREASATVSRLKYQNDDQYRERHKVATARYYARKRAERIAAGYVHSGTGRKSKYFDLDGVPKDHA